MDRRLVLALAVVGLQLVTPAVVFAQLPAGLIHRWQGEGDATDSVGANDGTLTNGVDFEAAVIGDGFAFDGIDDHVVIAQDTFDGRDAFTTSAWVKTSAGTGTEQTILAAMRAGSRFEWTIMIQAGQLKVFSGKGGACIVGAAVVLDTTAFHHVAATNDGTTVRLYVDGVERASGACGFTVGANPGSTAIGAHDPLHVPSRPWAGVIDEVRIYDRALSAAEIVTDRDFRPNTPPVGIDDGYAGQEDTPLAVNGVLDNDVDADGDALTAILVQDVSSGTLVLDPDGSFLYTPDPDFNGQDVFTYKPNDGEDDGNVATVMLDIGPVNDAPTAAADAHVAGADRMLSVAAPGVLANDGDVDGDPLTAMLDSPPSNGTVQLAADGSFTYAPDPDFSGTDSFSYFASDGSLQGGPATVTVDIPPCTYALSHAELDFGSDAGADAVRVRTQTDCSWSTRDGVSWASPGVASGAGPARVRVVVEHNPSALERSGTLRIGGQRLAITQSGAIVKFQVSPDAASFPAAGGLLTVDVTGTPDASWAAVEGAFTSIVGSREGSGSGSVEYTVAPNSSGDARSETLRVAGRKVTVRQVGSESSSLAPLALSVGSNGEGTPGATGERVGVFGVESDGRARGGWIQTFDGEGRRESSNFLPQDLVEARLAVTLPAPEASSEMVAVGSAPDGSHRLYLLDASGRTLLHREVLRGLAATEIVPVVLRNGRNRLVALITLRTHDGAAITEVWSLRRSGRDAALRRVGRHELVPSGFAGHRWIAADLDGDGSEELIAGYTGGGGRGAHFRVIEPRSGRVKVDRKVLGRAFDGATWMTGDFRGEATGTQILLGARRVSTGAGFLALFDGDGRPLLRRRHGSPGAGSLTWKPLLAGGGHDQVLAGRQDETGSWSFDVWDLSQEVRTRVGGAEIASADHTVDGWLVGNFDGEAADGHEIMVLTTDRADRTIRCGGWERSGHPAGDPMPCLDGTHIEPSAGVVRAVSSDRDDLLILARRVDAAPRILVMRLDGEVLVERAVLGRNVR